MENLFSCQMANCSMSFDDEDQLNAHKKKHELSLSLTPSSYKNPFILDQTPTPTQFLNPVSLELEDLQSDNPFDATFRRANSSNRASSNLIIPESSTFIASLPESEVLNTPSIILPSEPATPISLKPSIPKRLAIKNSDNRLTENSDSLPFTPNEQTVQSDSPEQSITDAELPSESANFSGIVSSSLDDIPDNIEKDRKKSIQTKNVLQTSVITSVGNTAILKGNAVGVPTAVVVTRAPINSISTLSTSQVSVVSQPNNQVKIQKSVPTVVQPLPVTTLLVSFNLSDGQILQLPVNSQPTSVANIAPQVTSTTSNAKMKLKEVLTQNQKIGMSVRKTNSSKSKVKSVHIHPDSSDGASHFSQSPPSSPIPYLKPGHNGRKRRDVVDDDEKRKRSLERNRAAATRCREKRKIWITNLEKKADELAQTNLQLQHEVTQLRNEVHHLKTLLLAHKDCPVTMQQRALVQEAEREESYTTVRIITSTTDDIQRVPNVSPSSPDFMEMEMEVSSVQSSSDSLTSDTSECYTYRER